MCITLAAMDKINEYIKEIAAASQAMEEEEQLFESMNAELDKTIEQDMQEISNLLNMSNESAETLPPPEPSVPEVRKSTASAPLLTSFLESPTVLTNGNVEIVPKTRTTPTVQRSTTSFPRPIQTANSFHRNVVSIKPKPIQAEKSVSKSIIEKIEQQILEADEDIYQSMNAELDKQIAKDMEAIKNYISKTDGKLDLAKRIEFFNTMDTSPIISNESHVTDHILLQHTPSGTIQWHECIHCNFKSTDKSKLREHIGESHTSVENTGWFRCPRCPYMSKRNEDVQRHLRLGHNEGADEGFKCKECNVTYTQNADLVNHMLTHRREGTFQCKDCSFKAVDSNELQAHRVANHIKLNISWYKCALCAYRTVRKANLDRHIMCKHTNNHFLL